MKYYRCSPTSWLRILEPRKPGGFEKLAAVHMTMLLPMALMYGIQNYKYTYGYTRTGQIYMDEYFSDALEVLYRGKRARLYTYMPESICSTKIPNEAVSEKLVPIAEEKVIPDVCEGLLELEHRGTLVLHRYQELSEKQLAWVRKVEADTIRSRNLLHIPGPEADYYRTHYPDSWAGIQEKEK